MADWIDETLIDQETHLVFDGIKGGSLVRAQYTYCQGVVLGLEVELAARTKDPDHAERVHRLVAAVRDNMAPGGVIQGAGGGDGGLFNGILARYLALVATTLPENTPADTAARAAAKELVLTSAKSAWDLRQTVDGLPLFAAFWDREAELPKIGGKEAQFVAGAVNASEIPERDLSVQLSGWMLMEAAHTLSDDGEPPHEPAKEEEAE
jgi:predicted alpha-1,6-mannanase (GH76 family)